ncbi:MAG: HAD family phosphatase [Paludibacteraceae bacterium]|nr:HAD family phosphatase [Paludibacteraceae bacterium]
MTLQAKPIIIFDLGGVLINLNVPRCIQAFSDLIGEENVRNILGMNKDGEGITSVSIATRQLMKDFERGLVTTDEFIDAILQYAPSGTTSDQIREAWFAMLEDLPQERLDYLAQLRQQGYRLYLLSNGNDLHWTYIDKLYHVSSYFEQVFLSQVMHCAKPEEEIFRRVQDAVLADIRSQHPSDALSQQPILFVDDLPQNRQAAEHYVSWRTFPDIPSLQQFLATK